MKLSRFKFKGYYAGQPVYFSIQDLYGNKSGIPCVRFNNQDISVHLLENVVRETGVKDPSGRMIWEGDVYEVGGWTDVVKWDDKSGGFGLWNEKNKKWDDHSLAGMPASPSKYCTYLGNIFEEAEIFKK